MKLGIDRLTSENTRSLGRCGLLCNQASWSSQKIHSIFVLKHLLGERLKILFSPQHGLESTVQDNMIETGHGIHPSSGLPLFSLYSETREPTESMMAHIDTMIIDIQIVGCRVYTFKWTIAACLRAAKKWNKKILILDRPNPLGGEIFEGRVLDESTQSFVGEDQIPMRHGLTVAEMALFLNEKIKAPSLEYILMEGWNPKDLWPKDKPWILTSPNLPTRDSLFLYPGMVALEGTNLSEGRGTGLPFQLVGAPYIKSAEELVREIQKHDPGEGLWIRPAFFQPTFHKWQGQTCCGVHFVVENPSLVRSYRLFLALMKAIFALDQKKQFQWKNPPYEYDENHLPIQLILGSLEAHDALRSKSVDDPFWSEGLSAYVHKASRFFLYQRSISL